MVVGVGVLFDVSQANMVLNVEVLLLIAFSFIAIKAMITQRVLIQMDVIFFQEVAVIVL